MALAAAAVASVHRSQTPKRRGESLALSYALKSSPSKGPDFIMGLATSVAASLVTAGLVSVVQSFVDRRGRLVADYDGSVDAWVAEARAELAFTAINVTATVRGALWNTTLSSSMQVFSNSEASFHDVEREKDLHSYTPLRFTAELAFDSYYPAASNSSRDTWESLPSRDDAPTVELHFALRNRSGHTSLFATQPWPLAFEEVVESRTPVSGNRCRREQGIFASWKCHLVKRLSEVCVQVEPGESGEWRPRLKSKSPRHHADAEGRSSGPPPASEETYGCGPQRGWHPTLFKVDECWAASSSQTDLCADRFLAHRVAVTLRSARDPFIRAEELTDDSFNFGLSAASQRLVGLVMLMVGLFLCILPIMRLHDHVKHRQQKKEFSSEDLRFRPLKKRTNSSIASAGIYGNQAKL